jgi:ligand-binding SRPBCC domain-containing protein
MPLPEVLSDQAIGCTSAPFRLKGVPTFARSVLIDAPVSTVFRFHERDDALSLLAPPFPPVRVLSKSGGIRSGARVELRVGFIPWVALHTNFEQDTLFVDKQLSGPFVHWVHRHEFEDVGIATRLTDRVDFLLPGGPVANAAFGWLVKLGLHQMFRYRHKVTKRFCEKGE